MKHIDAKMASSTYTYEYYEFLDITFSSIKFLSLNQSSVFITSPVFKNPVWSQHGKIQHLSYIDFSGSKNFRI